MLWFHKNTDSVRSFNQSISFTQQRDHSITCFRTWIWVNIGPGISLLFEGVKPSPDPMLTNYQFRLMAFAEGSYTENTQDI